VAWISEQKNTLSAVFYLAAMLVYLRFDQSRKVASYVGAFGLFALAVLSKTVTATLPGALLVIFWWQRGRLSWRRDVLPLVEPAYAELRSRRVLRPEREQVILLKEDSNLTAQLAAIDTPFAPEWLPAKGNIAEIGSALFDDYVQQSRLARVDSSGYPENTAGVKRERDILHQREAAIVSETDVFQTQQFVSQVHPPRAILYVVHR